MNTLLSTYVFVLVVLQFGGMIDFLLQEWSCLNDMYSWIKGQKGREGNFIPSQFFFPFLIFMRWSNYQQNINFRAGFFPWYIWNQPRRGLTDFCTEAENDLVAAPGGYFLPFLFLYLFFPSLALVLDVLLIHSQFRVHRWWWLEEGFTPNFIRTKE